MRYLHLNIKSISFIRIIKVLILTLSVFYLIQLISNKYWEFYQLIHSFKYKSVVSFIIIQIALMFLNFFIEAYKWGSYINNKTQDSKMSYLNYFKYVYIGHFMGMIIPLGVGDYIGRYNRSINFNTYIRATFLSKNCQMIVTSIAMFIVSFYIFDSYLFYFFSITSLLIVFTLFFIIVSFSRFTNQLNKILSRFIKKKFRFINRGFVILDIFKMSFYSLIRYVVFVIQFLLCLNFVGVKLNFINKIESIISVYYVKSIIPTWFDFGIRELSSTYFFGRFNVPIQEIIIASFILWIINFIIPFLIGLILYALIKKGQL